MQRKIFICLILLMILFQSCKPEPMIRELPNHHWGTASTKLNEEEWTCKPYAQLYPNRQKCFISLDSLLDDWRLRATIQFGGLPYPLAPGKYLLHSLYVKDAANALYTAWDYDLPLADFVIYEPDSLINYVEIESFDSITGEIKANFRATFLSATKSRDAYFYPDTLRITDGKVHTKIINL
jgi:hypothetical protein